MFIQKQCMKAGLYPYIGESGITSGFDFDVQLLVMDPGGMESFFDEYKETVFLLFEGSVNFSVFGQKFPACRKSMFTELPTGLHIAAGEKAWITAEARSEIYIQKAANKDRFAPRFYSPRDIRVQRAGTHGELNGCMERSIRTLFDNDNAPYSNMVIGEVACPPGLWSSYPPHHHPQPEVYFYRFSDPRGFGFGSDGDNVYRTEHNSLLLVSNDGTHEQVTAPGYAVCYVWGILHLEKDRWLKTRIDDPRHAWLLEKGAKILKPEDIV